MQRPPQAPQGEAAVRELVEEVLFLEQELGKAKGSNAHLTAQLDEARARLAAAEGRVAEYENGNAIRSLKQMLTDQQSLYERRLGTPSSARKPGSTTKVLSPVQDQRIATLEALVQDERRVREQAERALAQVQIELQRVRDEARIAQVQSTITKSEADTERDQRQDLREEFTRVQRNNEAAAREQRAAEKRYEALLDELHQVMEERDAALAARDEARRTKTDEERACQQFKLLADDARAARDAALERLAVAERARDLLASQKDAEERQRQSAVADLTMVKSQLETLIVERDAALRENERMSARLDEALMERRAAVQARSEAMAMSDAAIKTAEEAEHRARVESRRASEAEARRVEAEARASATQLQVGELGASLRKAAQELEVAKEMRLEAERDLEASQRQVRAMNEEMKSVLKARDAALAQREEAFLREERARGEASGAGLATAERVQREDWLQRELAGARESEAAAIEQCRRLERRLAETTAAAPSAQTPGRSAFGGGNPRGTPGRTSSATPQRLASSNSHTLAPGWTSRAMQEVKRTRAVLDQVKVLLQRDAHSAPSPPRAVPDSAAREDSADALLAHLVILGDVASDVSERAESVVERLHASQQATAQLQRRVEQLEWQTARGGSGGVGIGVNDEAELDKLRKRVAEMEQRSAEDTRPGSLAKRLDAMATTLSSPPAASSLDSGFDMDLRTLHRELQSKQAEVHALREQQVLLYQEIEQLNLRLQRATPHRHEVEQLRERLRQALQDLERAENEIALLRARLGPAPRGRGDLAA